MKPLGGAVFGTVVGMVGFEPTMLLLPKQAADQTGPHPVAYLVCGVRPTEPATGIEPAFPDYKTGVLPLN
jgi:hypothetical protein